jgi:hypothetical protein
MMMKWMAAILALAGCAPAAQTGGQTTTPPTGGNQTGGPTLMPCQESLVAEHVGKRFDPAKANAIRDQAKARTVRVVGPGDAVTMDYSPERLNINLDEKGMIVEFRCG